MKSEGMLSGWSKEDVDRCIFKHKNLAIRARQMKPFGGTVYIMEKQLWHTSRWRCVCLLQQIASAMIGMTTKGCSLQQVSAEEKSFQSRAVDTAHTGFVRALKAAPKINSLAVTADLKIII